MTFDVPPHPKLPTLQPCLVQLLRAACLQTHIL